MAYHRIAKSEDFLKMVKLGKRKSYLHHNQMKMKRKEKVVIVVESGEGIALDLLTISILEGFGWLVTLHKIFYNRKVRVDFLDPLSRLNKIKFSDGWIPTLVDHFTGFIGLSSHANWCFSSYLQDCCKGKFE